MTRLRTYTELRGLSTFAERFRYLSLRGQVARETFGFDRYINQQFYRSVEWRRLRREVILRDNGCDLGLADYPIIGESVHIHHMNPMTPDEIIHGEDQILDPEFLISVKHSTHNGIHYGDESAIPTVWTERTPHDTSPWKRSRR